MSPRKRKPAPPPAEPRLTPHLRRKIVSAVDHMATIAEVLDGWESGDRPTLARWLRGVAWELGQAAIEAEDSSA